MLPKKSFYMIRHGETEHNLANMVAGGETDSTLTKKGEQQAKNLAPFLQSLEIKPSKIFHSSMQRARKTAQYLNQYLQLEMEEIHDLREQELGEWEEVSWDDPRIEFFKDCVPEKGEASAQFAARVQRAITYCLEQTEGKNPPLIVCHGGLFFGLGIMYDIYDAITHIDNCHLHYFEPHSEHPFFPWKIVHYVPNGELLEAEATPFCATKLKRAS